MGEIFHIIAKKARFSILRASSFRRMVVRLVCLSSYWYWNQGGKLPCLFAEPPAHYRLVFSDEFDTLDVGTATASRTWCEGVWFSKDHAPMDRFSTAQSQLSLTWKRGQPSADSSISTFCRNSERYYAWRYGYFEARMKWKPEEGAWPAFWLIPVQAAREPHASETGEIDIFEGQGTEPRTFFGTIHRWMGSHQLASNSGQNHYRLPPQTDFSQFHNYGLLWEPGRVTWFFDGVPLHSEPTYGIFDKQDYFLVLGMQAGKDWKMGDVTGVKAQSFTLTVDWVRVWQRSAP